MISEARIHSFSATATLSAVTSTKNWHLRFVNKFFNNFVIFLFLYRKQDSSAEIVTRSFKTPQIQKFRFSTFHPLEHKRKLKTSVKGKLKALLSLQKRKIYFNSESSSLTLKKILLSHWLKNRNLIIHFSIYRFSITLHHWTKRRSLHLHWIFCLRVMQYNNIKLIILFSSYPGYLYRLV